MRIQRICEILNRGTILLRDGEEESVDPKVVNIVDCNVTKVAVDKLTALQHRNEIIEILKQYPRPDQLSSGASYIDVGAVVGSQETALKLFALGETAGLWKVVTPKQIRGIDDKKAKKMAGGGFVTISGFRPNSYSQEKAVYEAKLKEAQKNFDEYVRNETN